jgi:cytochrome c oxidase subunit 2
VFCHQANGEGVPGSFPALAGSAIATGPVENHIDIVVHGSKKNPTMAAFGQQLSDVDLAAVITYERNAFGNNTGDMVQPSDIAAVK